MPPTALVVDDSMLIRHTIGRFLQERGFQVELAANGREGWEAARRLLPSLIITDLQMPLMSGHELIDRLRECPDTATIPVVVLTGQPGTCGPLATGHARFFVSKDIDIEQQLDRAVAALH